MVGDASPGCEHRLVPLGVDDGLSGVGVARYLSDGLEPAIRAIEVESVGVNVLVIEVRARVAGNLVDVGALITKSILVD